MIRRVLFSNRLMRRPTRPLLIGVAVLACMAAVVFAARFSPASTPLPGTMKASFDPPISWADRFEMPVSASAQHLDCAVTFQNSGSQRSVRIDWFASVDNYGLANATQEITTSFLPTAIAKRAGRTDTFFVAGWFDRTSSLIVEKWTVGPMAIGISQPVGGGDPIVSILTAPITKTLLYSTRQSTTDRPARGVACNPWSDLLVLLLDSNPVRVVTLDADPPEEGVADLQPLISAANFPFLNECRTISTGVHQNAGLLMLFKPVPAWSEAISSNMLVLPDLQMDGVFDTTSIAVVSRATFLAWCPPSGWILDYEP